MPTIRLPSAVSLVVAALPLASACTGSSSSDSALEVRHTNPAVIGNQFHCTGTWPSQLTPCAYSWSSSPITDARDDGDIVHLTFARTPIPIDGGASLVTVDLHFAGDAVIAAKASESTTMAGTARQVESSEAIGGWIDPMVGSSAPGARNAGAFSLTFTWGSISGTYDTAP
jgi:hypothetical protein